MAKTRSTPATWAAARTRSLSSPSGVGTTMMSSPHPRDLGRDGVHQHRGGIGRLAAGDIEPGPIQGRDLLAQQGAVRLAIAPAGRGLVLGIGADARGGQLQGLALGGRDGVPGLFQAGARDLQVRRRSRASSGRSARCSPAGPRRHGRAGPRMMARDGLLDLVIGDGLPGEQGVEPVGKSASAVERRRISVMSLIHSSERRRLITGSEPLSTGARRPRPRAARPAGRSRRRASSSRRPC